MTFYDDAKRWWQSITVWFGVALVAAGSIVDYLVTASPTLAPYFGKWGGLVTVAIGVLNVVMRLRTNVRIGKPEEIKVGGTD